MVNYYNFQRPWVELSSSEEDQDDFFVKVAKDGHFAPFQSRRENQRSPLPPTSVPPAPVPPASVPPASVPPVPIQRPVPSQSLQGGRLQNISLGKQFPCIHLLLYPTELLNFKVEKMFFSFGSKQRSNSYAVTR